MTVPMGPPRARRVREASPHPLLYASVPVTGHLLLARSRPFREYARYGVRIELNPGGRTPKPTHGYDVQVRQSGRLVARVRRAVRCRTVRNFGGTRSVCRAVRASNRHA